MKHIFTILLSLFVLFSVFTIFPSAEALSHSVLPSAGVDYLFAHFSQASFAVDGKAEAEEYKKVHRIDPKTGDLIGTAQNFDPAFGGVQVAVSYDAEFVYIAVSDSSVASFASKSHASVGSCFHILVSVGFCDLFPEGLSECFNEYCFSASDLKCTSVFGHRISYENGKRSFRGQIYSLQPEMEVPCEIRGEVWNGKRYQSEAVLTMEVGENSFFECRIPICDIATSSAGRVPPKEGEFEDLFCGTFRLETDLLVDGKTQTFSLGIPSSSVISDRNVTWKEYLTENTAFSSDQIPDVISLPLFFCGKPVINENPIPPNTDHSFPATTSRVTSVPSLSETQQGSEPHFTLHDPFPGLPQIGESIPYETEILSDEESEGEKESTVGSVILFLSGILLVLSVLGTSLLYRNMEREEKNGGKKKKTQNKS